MRLACVEIVTRGCPRSAGSGRAAGAGCVYPSGITAMCLCRRAQLRRCKHADGRAGVCTSISCWMLPHAGGTRAVPDLPEQHLSSVRNNGLVLRLQLGRAETRLKATANIGYGRGGCEEFLWRNPSDRPCRDSRGFHTALFHTSLFHNCGRSFVSEGEVNKQWSTTGPRVHSVPPV